VNTKQAVTIAVIVWAIGALGVVMLVAVIRELSRTHPPPQRREGGVDGPFPEPQPIHRGQLSESERVLRAIKARREFEDASRDNDQPATPR
jgi:hypothetical protein